MTGDAADVAGDAPPERTTNVRLVAATACAAVAVVVLFLLSLDAAGRAASHARR